MSSATRATPIDALVVSHVTEKRSLKRPSLGVLSRSLMSPMTPKADDRLWPLADIDELRSRGDLCDMGLSGKNKSTFAGDLELLIGELCTDWGFCNQLKSQDLIADGQSVSAEAFADAVLWAEGMNPEYELQWRRRLRQRFTDRYGASISVEEYSQPSSF